MKRKIILAGGSGFLGAALARTFAAEGCEVVILSRHAAPAAGSIRTILWDARAVGAWAGELEGAAAIVNLAGRSVACRFTPENRRAILDSRLDSVRAVAAAVAACQRPPPVLIQASAIGFYGDAGDRLCDESTPPGSDFIAQVVQAWEGEFFTSPAVSSRRVALRIGFVLGRNGGALQPLARLARWFLGGSAGNGRQYISWIHLDDFCAMVRWAIDRPAASGIYNGTAPHPATNAAFMRVLRHTLGRPWSPPVPALAVKFGARFVVKADPDLALSGRRCPPKRILEAGFRFKYENLPGALADLLP